MDSELKERVRQIYLKQQKGQSELIRKEVDLIVQHPEILDEEFRKTIVLPWQREAVEARIAIVKETIQMERQLGDLDIAVGKMVELSKLKQLPPHIQALVPVANTKFGLYRDIHGKHHPDHLDRGALNRWIKAMQEDPSRLLPSRSTSSAVPRWAKPLIEALKQQKELSFNAAIRELNSKGITCHRTYARHFVRRKAEELRQLNYSKR